MNDEFREAFEHLKAKIRKLEENPFWAEEFRKMDEWKQAIRDLHGREPNDQEISAYYDSQNPFKDEE